MTCSIFGYESRDLGLEPMHQLGEQKSGHPTQKNKNSQ